MADRQKILIVDNDENITDLISMYLTKEYYETICAYDGQTALDKFNTCNPDLIILDLMMPGIDGYQICRHVREKSRTPIIIVSAKTDVFDKVLGLELGADDYMIKPFDMKELVARVKAVLRRTAADPASPAPEAKKAAARTLEYEDLSINMGNYSVTCKGEALDMPPKEIELLYFLASSPNQVFTRDQLLSNIWGYDYAGDTRTVDVHIKRLREKLGSTKQWSISTVWGVGYKFNVY